MTKSAFKLRSGNSPAFKALGGSPARDVGDTAHQDKYPLHDDDLTTEEEHADLIAIPEGADTGDQEDPPWPGATEPEDVDAVQEAQADAARKAGSSAVAWTGGDWLTMAKTALNPGSVGKGENGDKKKDWKSAAGTFLSNI